MRMILVIFIFAISSAPEQSMRMNLNQNRKLQHNTSASSRDIMEESDQHPLEGN